MGELQNLIDRFNRAGTTSVSGSLVDRFNRLDGQNIYPGVDLNVYQHGKPISGPAYNEYLKSQAVQPSSTRKYDPLDPFGGMSGEEMALMYRQHQNALMNIGGRTGAESGFVPEPDAPLPFVSFEWWGKVGEDIDRAGADLLDLFYKKTESLASKYGEWTAPKTFKVEDKKFPTSSDSFLDPEFEAPKGLSPEDAPYAYKGLQSAVGVLSGLPHLIGGIGTIRDAYRDEGFRGGNAAVGQAGAGLLSLVNPFDPNIDGPERFHRSLNVAFLAAGGMKGFKSFRERGMVKTLVKEHGLEKQDARLIVHEVQKGLKQIDAELGAKNAFSNALDDITLTRARQIVKTIDPERFVAETINPTYVPPVLPAPDMPKLEGQEFPLPQSSFPVGPKELDLTTTPQSMRTRADRLQLLAEEAQVEAVRTGDSDQFAAAAQMNGKASYLREQARILESANEAADHVPSVTFRKVQPAVNGDGPGPGRHAPDAGDPVALNDPVDVPPGIGETSETGRITVDPITDGDVVPDDEIWKEFFETLRSKPPRQTTTQKGKIGKGRFNPEQATIVVRSLRNASTVSHEAGHQFNQLYKLSENAPPEEIAALLGDLDVIGTTRGDEAVAEFVRGMMVNPDEAARRAPTIYKKYQRSVPDDVKKAIELAGKRIRRTVGQDPVAMTLGQVDLEGVNETRGLRALASRVWEAITPSPKALSADSTKPYKTPFKRIVQSWIGNDDQAALVSAVEYVKEVRMLSELMPEEDAVLLASRNRYVNNQVAETIAGGLRDQYGQVLYFNNATGLLQQVGHRKVKFPIDSPSQFAGQELELPLVQQIDSNATTKLEPSVIAPDGEVYDLSGYPRVTNPDGTLGINLVVEPMTLKWVLQPLKSLTQRMRPVAEGIEAIALEGPEKFDVDALFQQFIAKGVSERALELWGRNRADRLPGLVDELLDAAHDEISPLIEGIVDAANIHHKNIDAITVESFMDVVNGAEKGNAVSNTAVEMLLNAIEARKWESKEAVKAVRMFKQQSRNLTGAGRGLVDDVSIAEAALDQVVQLSPENMDLVTEALFRYRKYSDALLRYMVSTDVLDQAGYQAITERNKNYFDLGRVMDELSDKADVPRYHRDDIKALTGKARGAAREIESPVVNLIANTEQAIRLGERNRILNSFLEPIRSAKDPVQKNLLASVAEKVEEPGVNTVRVFHDGKPEFWKLESGVYEAVKPDSLLSGVPKIILDVVSVPRDLIMWGVTNMPNFIVRNVIRDYMDARIKGSKISVKETIKAFNATPEDAGFYDYFGGGIAIWQDVSLRKGWHKIQRDLLKQIGDNEPIILAEGAMPDGTTKRAPVSVKGPRLQTEKGWYGPLRSKAERAARLAEYRKALTAARQEYKSKHPGWSEERIEYNAHLKAGQAARDIIDFARGAKVWKAVNRLVPFVNARIQGFSTSSRDLAAAVRTRDIKKLKPLALKMVSTMAGIQAAEFAINKMAGTEEQWRDQPAYMKDLFWLFPTGSESNVFIRVPKPFEFGVMASIFPRLVYNDWEGFLAEEGSPLKGSLAEMLSPVAYDDLMFGPMQVPVELATNHDTFRRRPIVPEYEKDRALSERKGAASASTLAQVIDLNLVDPRYIDHTIQGFLGNFGQTLTTVADKPDAESIPRYINALVGLTTTDGSSNSAEVRKTLRYAGTVGFTGVFEAEFNALSEARGGDVFTGGHKVWEAKRRMIEKARKINALIEEKTQGRDSKQQLEIIKAILRDFS